VPTIPGVRLRRTAALLLLLPAFVGCGGDDGGDGGDSGDGGAGDLPGASGATTTPADDVDGTDACALLGIDEVAHAVGTEVEEGVAADGPVATGGTQTTCTWRGVENPSATAMVTVYSDASAADSVRQDDSEPLPEVGEDAFVGPFASVWAYAGGGSFTAQWYDFSGSDEENLPKSTALALLVRDAL
jgi:hypothetical protein